MIFRYIKPSDDSWLVNEDAFDPQRVAHYETLFTLANGYAGVRGSIETNPNLGTPGFYVAGVFDQVRDFEHEIVNLPCWLPIHANLDGFEFDLSKGKVLEYRRSLDMRQGLLFTTILWQNEIKWVFRWESVRLLHQVDKHVSLICGRITALTSGGNLQLSTSLDAWAVKHGSCSGGTRYGDIHTYDVEGIGIGVDVTTRKTGIKVAEATSLSVQGSSKRRVDADDDRIRESHSVPLQLNQPVYFEKRTAVYTSRDTDDPVAAAKAELQRVNEADTQQLVTSHTKAWEKLWQAADITIEGDPRAQQDIRFNIFHLMSLANPADDGVSLGAKGLHGNGYKGLVFWDTEVYLVPHFIYTDPAAARAMLQYRHHFLPDAVENARANGRQGAYYPWNSSLTGREASWPGWQEHVGSDIAYAVDQYVQSTCDSEFLIQYGAELIIATAQYWPSRVEFDAGKGYVIRDLTGPDEIHSNIDNNTFTNYLVKWHLNRALRAIDELRAVGAWGPLASKYGITDGDIEKWREIADGMYINFSSSHGFHEQFDGFFQLKQAEIDRDMTQMEYTGPVLHSFRPTQVSKQADTVLMHFLFPHDFSQDVTRRAYEYYEPRCAHTSTLSRGMHACVAARLGITDEAYQQFLLSAEVDTGPMAECDTGIHAASLGGNWQAVVMGFAGFSIREGKPSFDPHLPGNWERLAFKLQWQGKTISVDARQGELRLKTHGGAVEVMVGETSRLVGREEIRVAHP
jgi:kojibiose phosphorylase